MSTSAPARRTRSTPLPTGIVAFLFTDLEGSTARWDRHPEAMEDAVRRHDALLHRIMNAHGGAVFKTVGDAFCVAFARTEDAIAAAVAAQRGLAAEDFEAVGGLRARIGIHTGIADERDDDYYGPTLNRVSRLCAIGHGGQILISRVAYELAVAAGSAFGTRDLGEHALQDLARPEHVFQVVADGLDHDFPRLRSNAAVGETLPHYPTSFLGREHDVAWIARRMESTRLLSLVGTGGVGKTRLAVETARSVRARFPGGVYFVDLAPLADGRLVAPSLAALLGAREVTARSYAAAAAAVLGDAHALLVLDNCEHVIDAVAATIDAVLRDAPNVRALTTSREALRVQAEVVYRVEPLGSGARRERDALPSLAELEASPAIALFMDRARGAVPTRTFADRDRAPLAQIARTLDGLPLAIELAAARTDSLDLADLASRLEDRLRFLEGGSRANLPHQRALRSLIDWSYELLNEPERRLFARLAVFAGGWTLEAAEDVASDDGLAADDIFELLAHLHDKSLVVRDHDADRFYLLDTIRGYALERLAQSGEREAVEVRLAARCAGLAERAEPFFRSAYQEEWVERIDLELNNVRVVLDAAARNAALAKDALRINVGLARYWLLTGAYSEGRARLRAALARASGPMAVALRGWVGDLLLALNQQRKDELPAISAKIEALARELGDGPEDRWAAAYARVFTSPTLVIEDEATNRARYDALRTLPPVASDPWLMADVVWERAHHIARSDRAQAVDLFEEALVCARRSGDRFVIAGCASALAYSLIADDPASVAAAVRLAESARQTTFGNFGFLASALEGLTSIAVARGDDREAATLLGAARHFRREFAVPAWRLDPESFEPIVAERLGASTAGACIAAGDALNEADAIALAEAYAAALKKTVNRAAG